MAPTVPERELLEVARAAARGRALGDQQARQRSRQERDRRAAVAAGRANLPERLFAGAGIGAAEIAALQTQAADAFRERVEEVRRARASPSGAPAERPAAQRRASPLPFAPELFNLLVLDTATFVGPPVDSSSPGFRTLVVPDPPAPQHNFARAFLEVSTEHKHGFDLGHFNFGLVEAFFAFTAESDLTMNAGGFADWTVRDALIASWYPFDTCDAEAILTLGMDAFVVSPQGQLVGRFSAAPEQEFDDAVEIGPFDFYGADLENTYSSNTAFFLWGIPVAAGSRVFFRLHADLEVHSKSTAYAYIDLTRGDEGINFPLVYAATFSPQRG